MLLDPVFSSSDELFIIHHAFQILYHVWLNWPNERKLSVPFDVYSIVGSNLDVVICFVSVAPEVLLSCMNFDPLFCFCNSLVLSIANYKSTKSANNKFLFEQLLQIFIKFERISFPQAAWFAGINSAFWILFYHCLLRILVLFKVLAKLLNRSAFFLCWNNLNDLLLDRRLLFDRNNYRICKIWQAARLLHLFKKQKLIEHLELFL